MVDSLGAYKAASWYIDEHTSQIHVGLPDAVSRQGLVKAAIRIGVPTDAVVASLDSGSQTFQATLDSKVRPIAGGLITYEHQWPPDGTHSNSACTFTGIYYQDFYTMFLTAAHCVNFSAHGGDQNWSVYQDVVNGTGYCSTNCIGMVDDNPAFVAGGTGCPSGAYCRLSDAAAGLPTGGTGSGGGPGQLALPLNGPVALPATSASLDIDTTSHINLAGNQADVMVGDTLSKIGTTTGWTKGVVFAKNEARSGIPDGLYRLATTRIRMGGSGGDSGAPVLFKSAGGYYLYGLMWGGGSDSVSQYISVSTWANISSELLLHYP